MRLPSLLLVLAVLLAGCTSSGPAPAPAPSLAPAPLRTACGSPVGTGPLPEWARAGFTGDSSMPHVLGDRGEIVAAIFGYPLDADRPEGPSNKILWVPQTPSAMGDLVIEARLDGTDGAADTATRTVTGGPGPSIVDLPRAGCWRLTLTWPGHTDTMELVYQP